MNILPVPDICIWYTIEIWKPAGHCDRQKTNPVGHTWNPAGQWPLTDGYFMHCIKQINQIFETEADKKLFFFSEQWTFKKKCATKMLIICQRILDWVFRNLESSKNILNFNNNLLRPDDYFGWALRRKHLWTVPTTSFNPFCYIYSILLQNYWWCTHSLSLSLTALSFYIHTRWVWCR